MIILVINKHLFDIYIYIYLFIYLYCGGKKKKEGARGWLSSKN